MDAVRVRVRYAYAVRAVPADYQLSAADVDTGNSLLSVQVTGNNARMINVLVSA